ncbi:hypothetical protein V6x_28080 [Gimesia chilikensis]|uniref:Uncharacterized protein n=1 Tax=Gimesia chilikensis TaxID=2605989 RepID=A0A517WCX0_9PLAN|nr:hypothetical protein [Gimesia chilikensis]QDU03096.1 hypothetical protein V6x_28080 [Gimesia chilikensis]
MRDERLAQLIEKVRKNGLRSLTPDEIEFLVNSGIVPTQESLSGHISLPGLGGLGGIRPRKPAGHDLDASSGDKGKKKLD